MKTRAIIWIFDFGFLIGRKSSKDEMTRAKTQSTPSSERIGNYFSWRLIAKNFVEVVLLNILWIRI